MRAARLAQGLTLADLGARVGYSGSEVSRYERGIVALTDTRVLRRFATALSITPEQLGLHVTDQDSTRHAVGLSDSHPRRGHGNTVNPGRVREDGEDPVRRRQLLANVAALTAAGAAGGAPSAVSASTTTDPGALLAASVRDAMLGLSPAPARITTHGLQTGLAAALAAFRSCQYTRLAGLLPRLVTAGHALAADGTPQAPELLAEIYTLTTRTLIKLDDQQISWMAADRARVLAAGSTDPLLASEAARNLAVLARKAGWYEQAISIALSAAAAPGLAGNHPQAAAERGLLVQSAAYTAARSGDRDTMRELTDQATAIAGRFGTTVMLRDHGGGSPPRPSNCTGFQRRTTLETPPQRSLLPGESSPPSLPTRERRARYWTDTANAYHAWDRRDPCIQALLAAEYEAPQEVRARPAIRALIRALLLRCAQPAGMPGQLLDISSRVH